MTEHDSSPLARVPGFRAVGVTCGLKKSGNPDLTLLLADRPCAAAAMFTTNQIKAAPVLYDMALMKKSADKLRGLILNAGNANAVTGQQGLADAEQMARLVESACDLPSNSIFVMSTGIIGEKLPMDKVAAGVKAAAERIQTQAGQCGEGVAQAIMTTDTVPKAAFGQIEIDGVTVSVGGVAKGSGMIEPNMATMLSAIVTDAAIDPATLRLALTRAVEQSFHRVTVDGDTSTNDTVLLLASGAASHSPIAPNSPAFDTFTAALTRLSVELAKAIARDGEGATKLIEVAVSGAASESEAAQAAKTIANSPLVKTAIFGNDPNWGRVLMAVGRSGVQVAPERVSFRLGDIALVANGEPQPFDAVAVHHWLASIDEVRLAVDLGLGEGQAVVWTCDYSYDYIKINAEYHT